MPAKKAPADVTSAPGPQQALLRVARAVPKDAGRGLARLNPADVRASGWLPGDMVTVTYRERATVLKAMPVVAAERASGRSGWMASPAKRRRHPRLAGSRWNSPRWRTPRQSP